MVTKRRFAFHMKPGCGPTMEGLLVKYHRRIAEFELLDAKLVETEDRSTSIAGPVFLPRENVFCRQVIT